MLRRLLIPLAGIYGILVSIRNFLFDAKILPRYKSKLPVICVGNITIGGNGKTPFCIYLLETLRQLGFNPVLLSRGYGGSLKGPIVVEPQHQASDVGDEALLYKLRTEVPVVISRDRVAGSKFIESEMLGDCIVLDDGYQHRYLDRDVNLLLVDSQTPGLAKGAIEEALIPMGRLREPAQNALRRADAIVIVRKNILADEFPALYQSSLKSWDFTLLPGEIVDLYNGESIPVNSLLNTDATVVTAIARPESFKESLRQIAIHPKESFIFRDHHNYSEREWFDILKRSSGLIVTTEKDSVKLKRYLNAEGQLFVLRLKGELCDRVQEPFSTWLLERIRKVI